VGYWTLGVIAVFAGTVAAILAVTPVSGVDGALVVELTVAIVALAVIVHVNAAQIAGAKRQVPRSSR
jgi:hypothetical protein